MITLNPPWREDGHRFVASLTKLLSLLMDYRSLIHDGDGDKLAMCTFALLRFYRDEIDSPNRTSLIIRYIHKLVELHLPSNNYTEAAFTLQMHADLLMWDQKDVTSQKCMGDKCKWTKEALYERMIEYFDRGSNWEDGVKCCKELIPFYEHHFKLEKMSQVLKIHAKFLDNILTKMRPEHEYFRVGFYGLDFPPFLRNKIFVFRGLELEKIADFTQRIQNEFPSAEVMTKNVPPDESITQSQAQYIQIVAVKPVPEPPQVPPSAARADKIISYYNTNRVRKFIYDRPVQRAPFDPNNEFKSLWIERTHLIIEHPLPGALGAFEVVNSQVTQITPAEFACETIENMNVELSKLISNYTIDGRNESISPLSMRLQVHNQSTFS